MTVSPKTIRKIKRGELPKEGKGYYFMHLTDYYDTKRWDDLRIEVFKRDERKCVHCHTSFDLQAHHIQYPEYFFIRDRKYINIESDNIENLITLCGEHHSEIHQHRISVNRNMKNHTYIYEEEKPEDEIDFNMVTFPTVPDAEDDE